MNRRERRATTKSSRVARNTSAKGAPDALCETGLRHFRVGQYLDAQLCCQQALEAKPDHAAAMHLMGLLSLHAKQYDHATEWLTRAIRLDPNPEYLVSLGTALQQQGRHDDALKVFDKSLQLDPHHQDALSKSGALLNQLGRHEEALALLDRSDVSAPSHAPTRQARAWALYHLKRWDESLAEGSKAYELDPGNADTCNNLGLALWRLSRNEEALPWYDRALEIRPNFAAAFGNKIIALFHLHRFDEVFALHDRMKVLGLKHTLTDWNVALVHLLTGNFEAGWNGHQVRLTLPSATYPQIPRPMWLGDQDIEGKTILIAADEGLGDTIQFVRYVPMLAERGARVLLVVQDSLHRLLSGLSGVVQCAPTSAVSTLPAFDLHCPISSLPMAFKTRIETIPSAASYLPSPPADRVQAWKDRLGPRTKFRVGLVWSGSPNHLNDHNRSVPLQILARLFDIDATFISLQKDPRPGDAAMLQERDDIIDLTADLSDFTETAALVSCLDLIITVDTSVAHLAGALGRPTWILLPYTPDYRWLLDRTDSPWYPSVRLFRQSETREYASVLDRVRDELQALTLAFRSEES